MCKQGNKWARRLGGEGSSQPTGLGKASGLAAGRACRKHTALGHVTTCDAASTSHRLPLPCTPLNHTKRVACPGRSTCPCRPAATSAPPSVPSSPASHAPTCCPGSPPLRWCTAPAGAVSPPQTRPAWAAPAPQQQWPALLRCTQWAHLACTQAATPRAGGTFSLHGSAAQAKATNSASGAPGKRLCDCIQPVVEAQAGGQGCPLQPGPHHLSNRQRKRELSTEAQARLSSGNTPQKATVCAGAARRAGPRIGWKPDFAARSA